MIVIRLHFDAIENFGNSLRSQKSDCLDFIFDFMESTI